MDKKKSRLLKLIAVLIIAILLALILFSCYYINNQYENRNAEIDYDHEYREEFCNAYCANVKKMSEYEKLISDDSVEIINIETYHESLTHDHIHKIVYYKKKKV